MQPFSAMFEYANVLLAFLVLSLMMTTHPKKTYIYRLNRAGIAFSLLESTLGILLSFGYLPVGRRGSFYAFSFSILYCIIYTTIVSLLLAYVDYLVNRVKPVFKKISIHTMLIAISVINYFLFYFYRVPQYNTLTPCITLCQDTVFICAINGLWTCAFILISCLPNIHKMTKIVRYAMWTNLPLCMFILIIQLFNRQTVLIGLTYILPFTLMYVLFHSTSYDEATGSQNSDALNNLISTRLENGKSFIITFVEFPLLKISESKLLKARMMNICRTLESGKHDLSVFRVSTSIYAIITSLSDERSIETITDDICRVMSLNFESDVYIPSKHNVYSIYCTPSFTTPDMVYAFRYYLKANHPLGVNTEYYIPDKNDYINFASAYEIQSLLEEIQDQNNLEDPRILCYAQPIYDISSNTFKTAEALMRLSLGEETIQPSVFIPIAERSGCIHVLTVIMLNKVCKSIQYLINNGYKFDAITVNCSALEFSDEHLYRDLTSVIDSYSIPKTKIRIEITESAIFDNYETVLHNMNDLQESGIAFYLDDFGTGYSNMERISSCSFHTIKFDKSVMNRAMVDPALDNLINSYMDMMGEKGISTLVEGVETDDQVEFSKRHGFDYIQGFKYAKPEPIENLSKFFSKD